MGPKGDRWFGILLCASLLAALVHGDKGIDCMTAVSSNVPEDGDMSAAGVIEEGPSGVLTCTPDGSAEDGTLGTMCSKVYYKNVPESDLWAYLRGATWAVAKS